jgi:predicted small lipoprotein YifL
MEPIRRRLAILLTLTALACATACGNKGDLVRPADVPPPAPAAAAADS